MNWCSWKPNILFCGSSFPRPSICAHSKELSSYLITHLYLISHQLTCIFKWFDHQIQRRECWLATLNAHQKFQGFNSTINSIKLLKKRMMYTIFFRQIHGAESTVQLWQLTSNKLNPVMELLRKTWTTFDIFIVNWVFDHFHPLVVFYFLEYYQSTKKGSSAWLHLSIIVNCSPWAAMSCCVYGTGTIPPLIQIQIRRGSRSLVVNWMRSTLSASPTFYKQIFSFFQILKFQSCLLNTWFYKDILLYQKYTEVIT